MALLKNCRKAEIFTPELESICEAGVVHDMSGDVIRLVVSRDFPVGKYPSFLVSFSDATVGLVECRCNLSAPENTPDGLVSYACDVIETISQTQRRRDLKVPLEVDLDLSCVYVPRGTERPPEAKFSAYSRNLSAGGIYFVCKYSLPKNALVRFQFMEATKPLLLTAEVLWKEELPPVNGVPQYGHGCRFSELDAGAEAELRSYIFRNERRLLQLFYH